MVIIPIRRNIRNPIFDFPIGDSELQSALAQVGDDLEGLGDVHVISPRRNVEYGFFARYDPFRRDVYFFAPTVRQGQYVLGRQEQLRLDAGEFRRRILGEVVFHEIGHHVGWLRFGDLSEEFADHYAEMHRGRMN